MRIRNNIGTFHQLEIVLCVYDAGSISKAAELMHLTQPTLSMQLKKLSESIGMALYDQIGKRLVFTEAGEKVVASARDILSRISHLEMELAELQGLKSGTLKLAVVTTAKYFIPHLLGPFCRRYPAVDIEFNVGNRQQIIQRLHRGHDDFYVFSNLPETDDIETIDFLDNPLVAIAPADHPLADVQRISLEMFAKEPFLAREQGSGTRGTLERFLQKQGVTLNVKMTIESNEAIKHAVIAGLGVSILSKHTLTFGESRGIKILDVDKLPIPSKWFLVRNRPKNLSPIAKTFLNDIQAEGRDLLRQELKNA